MTRTVLTAACLTAAIFTTIESKAQDLSLRKLLDAPAGKHGFVKICPKSKRLVFEDGTPARFFGMAFKKYFNEPRRIIPKEEICKVLDDMASYGVNLVRNQTFSLRMQQGTFGKGLNATAIKNADLLVSEAKKRGIYIHYNLNTSYRGGYSKLIKKNTSSRNSMIIIDEFIRLQQTFIRNFLNHVNEYTGIAYKDEPTIISLQLGNEQHAYSRVGWRKWTRATGKHKQEIQAKWNKYLLDKFHSRAGLKKAWGELLENDEDPERGTVKINNPRYVCIKDKQSTTIREDEAVLCADLLQDRFYKKMYKFIREDVGDKKHLISDNGWLRGNKRIIDTAARNLDLMDLQHYWLHGPRKRFATPFEFDTIRDGGVSMLNSMLSARERQGMKKPFIVTEYNAHIDGNTCWEIFPLHTLMLGLTGGDGQTAWYYSTGKKVNRHWFAMNFNISPLRLRMIPYAAASQIARMNIPEVITRKFLKEEIKPRKCKRTLVVDYDEETIRYDGQAFVTGGIKISFKDGIVAVQEKNWMLYLGRGKFGSKQLSFAPENKKKKYMFAAFTMDGKPFGKSKYIRIYSNVSGKVKLPGDFKAALLDRYFKPYESKPAAATHDITADDKLLCTDFQAK
jgi:hypothetical protein